jgi:hypothetical protein
MNYKSKWIFVSVTLLAMLLMESALAGSMRCGRHIISTGGLHGPGKYEVLKKCGEPTARSGDTWIYDKPGGVKHVVVFDASGYLARIG